jgi:multisubunit Na+/H+ antiporter MnhC subunit
MPRRLTPQQSVAITWTVTLTAILIGVALLWVILSIGAR